MSSPKIRLHIAVEQKNMRLWLQQYFIEYKTKISQPCKNFLWAFVLRAIINGPLELVISRVELLVSHRTPHQVADRGRLTRYGG
jgi:hypothetical protein